jgi:hypothetical protein
LEIELKPAGDWDDWKLMCSPSLATAGREGYEPAVFLPLLQMNVASITPTCSLIGGIKLQISIWLSDFQATLR